MGQTGNRLFTAVGRAPGTLDTAGGVLKEKTCWRRIPTMSTASPG